MLRNILPIALLHQASGACFKHVCWPQAFTGPMSDVSMEPLEPRFKKIVHVNRSCTSCIAESNDAGYCMWLGTRCFLLFPCVFSVAGRTNKSHEAVSQVYAAAAGGVFPSKNGFMSAWVQDLAGLDLRIGACVAGHPGYAPPQDMSGQLATDAYGLWSMTLPTRTAGALKTGRTV